MSCYFVTLAYRDREFTAGTKLQNKVIGEPPLQWLLRMQTIYPQAEYVILWWKELGPEEGTASLNEILVPIVTRSTG